MFKKYFSGLSKNTFLLALSSLFADISTEMLYPILPIYLTQVLHTNGSIVGIIEGIAIATQNIVQGFSGWLSDKLRKRKKIALVGYTLAAISKHLTGFAGTWEGVLGARFLDRFGTGTRSAPRDALIAESADAKHRGKAFGLEGVGDNLGAFLGPLIGLLLISWFVVPIRTVFYFAFIPGVLAIIMIFLVKEKKRLEEPHKKVVIHFKQFPTSYWRYIFGIAIFGLGNSAGAFLILQTRGVGISLAFTILIYAFYNLIAALSSYPAGVLSDRFGRKILMLSCFFIFIAVYLGFWSSSNLYIIGFLFLLYGVYQGIFRAVGKTFATDFVEPHLRASSIGWYSTTVGLSGLIASIVAGFLWDKVSHPTVFIYGVFFATLGFFALLFLVPKNVKQ